LDTKRPHQQHEGKREWIINYLDDGKTPPRLPHSPPKSLVTIGLWFLGVMRGWGLKGGLYIGAWGVLSFKMVDNGLKLLFLECSTNIRVL
jgi:hypothetical protein